MDNDDLLARIQETTLELPGSRKSIADFLIREGGGVENLSMAEVADLTFTSKPSLVRFAKTFGFAGWRDFRLAFVTLMRQNDEDIAHLENVDPNHPFAPEDSVGEAVQSVLALEQRALADAADVVDVNMLVEASRRIIEANRTVFFGYEPNYCFGRLLAYKLAQIGIRCLVPSPEDWESLARTLGPNECAIIASYSGMGPHREPVSFAPMFAQAGVPVIAITNAGDNWLREQCDCVLSFRPRERYYSKISGYYSEQCIHFLLDALYSAIFCADYDRNEVRKLHTVIAFERTHNQNLVDELPC